MSVISDQKRAQLADIEAHNDVAKLPVAHRAAYEALRKEVVQIEEAEAAAELARAEKLAADKAAAEARIRADAEDLANAEAEVRAQIKAEIEAKVRAELAAKTPQA